MYTRNTHIYDTQAPHDGFLGNGWNCGRMCDDVTRGETRGPPSQFVQSSMSRYTREPEKRKAIEFHVCVAY